MKSLKLSKLDSIIGATPNIDTSFSSISLQNMNSQRPPCQILFESSQHNIEDANHACHMDEANEMDSETTIIGKRRVIEEILIGRTGDD